MRTLLITLLFAALICFAGCAEKATMTATLLGSPGELEDFETEYTGRVGVQIEQTEVGIATCFWPESDVDQVYEIYALQFLTDPNGLGLIGRPYIGGHITLDKILPNRVVNNGGMYAFITGTAHEIGGVEILTEFQWRLYTDSLEEHHDNGTDRYKVGIGPRFSF